MNELRDGSGNPIKRIVSGIIGRGAAICSSNLDDAECANTLWAGKRMNVLKVCKDLF